MYNGTVMNREKTKERASKERTRRVKYMQYAKGEKREKEPGTRTVKECDGYEYATN